MASAAFPPPAPLPVSGVCGNPSGGYEGFGRSTTGGAGQSVYRVTSLADSGAGTLRDALSQGNRCVVFDVAGTINLSSELRVKSNTTVDGFTAPSPGITVRMRTVGIDNATNVIVRGLRVRDTLDSGAANQDGIRIYNSSNVVVSHCSFSRFEDGGVDVTQNSNNVTLQWNIFGNGNPAHNFLMLVSYAAKRVSVHHNLFIDGTDRQPAINQQYVTPSSETTADVRNNVMWNIAGDGTTVRYSGRANVINNYYDGGSGEKAVQVNNGGFGYVSGNMSRQGLQLNDNGNQSAPFPAVAPATTDAVTAAHAGQGQRRRAGSRGLRSTRSTKPM